MRYIIKYIQTPGYPVDEKRFLSRGWEKINAITWGIRQSLAPFTDINKAYEYISPLPKTPREWYIVEELP